MGKGAVMEHVHQKWFSRFSVGGVDTNTCYMTKMIADILQISKSSVENHLHQVGSVSGLNICVPHQLNDINLTIFLSVTHLKKK